MTQEHHDERIFDLYDESSKYVPTLQATPSAVFIDDNSNQEYIEGRISFKPKAIDSILKSHPSPLAGRIVIVMPPRQAHKPRWNKPTTSDIAESLCALGLVIPGIYGKTTIIASNKAWGLPYDYMTSRREELDRARLSDMGILPIDSDRFKTLDSSSHMVPYDYENVMYFENINKSLNENGIISTRLSVYNHYVSAMKTKALSNLEFAYELITTGQAISNTIMQPSKSLTFSSLPLLNDRELFSKLMLSFVDIARMKAPTNCSHYPWTQAPDIKTFKLNLLADIALGSIRINDAFLIATDLDYEIPRLYKGSMGIGTNYHKEWLAYWARFLKETEKIIKLLSSDAPLHRMSQNMDPYDVILKLYDYVNS